jgi:AcrR family transcriptional regulator
MATTGPEVTATEGLRERKKRLTRQQLSDTATRLFLERGFDAVRVAEIAAACGVSEKTVFNYFPTKESLLLDRLDSTVAAVRAALAEPGLGPVPAVLRVLDGELDDMVAMLSTQDDPAEAAAQIGRFRVLMQSTASLRAHQRDRMDQLVAVAAEVMAARAGMSPDEPEPQIAATALLGLWQVQYKAMRKYQDGVRTPAQIRTAVAAEVHRAAHLLSAGLRTFPTRPAAPGVRSDRPTDPTLRGAR